MVTRSRVRERAPGESRHGASFFDEVRPEDVYLVSFPRSGNTYLRYLLAALILDEQPTPEQLRHLVPDVHRSESPTRPDRPRVIAKSHGLVRPIRGKVVYIVRDGRAALLSYYHYLAARGRPIPTSPAGMLNWSGIWPCAWDEHVAGWMGWLERSRGDMLLHYEDLVARPGQALAAVARLSGISASPDQVHRAVHLGSWESMRSAEAAAGAGSLNFVGLPRSDWRTTFPREDLRRFDRRCGPLLVRLGYPFHDSLRGLSYPPGGEAGWVSGC